MNIKSKVFRTLLESSLSILPVIFIILILSWTGLSPIDNLPSYLLLLIGGFVLIIGMTIFSIGADQSLSKVGQHIGASLSKQKNIFVVIIVSVMLGALVTAAEPSIKVLASEIPIPDWLFILVISIGVGIFVSIGVIRVFKHQSFRVWVLVLYGLLFALWIFLDTQGRLLIPLAFDSGGAALGSATVPFLLALGAGVAAVRGGDKSQEDSFGLIALSSIGPILLMIVMVLLSKDGFGSTYVNDGPVLSANINIWDLFKQQLFMIIENGNIVSLGLFVEIAIAIAPIMIIFFIYQKLFIKLPKSENLRIFLGFVYSYFGLVLFLSAIQAAMLPFGKFVGSAIGRQDVGLIIIIAFLIGLVTILCEPAAHILTKQVENISDGAIPRFTVLFTLSIGVGVAIALCAVRAIYNFDIAYYIVPGYLLAIALSFVAPPMYTALAFDSGVVVSGPMTVSFVLSFIIGITLEQNGGDLSQVMSRSFGVVSMVSLTPLIAIQVLGITARVKEYRKLLAFKTHIFGEDDGQIIHFNEEER